MHTASYCDASFGRAFHDSIGLNLQKNDAKMANIYNGFDRALLPLTGITHR